MVAAAERRAAAAAAEADYERDRKQATSCLIAFGKAGVMPNGAMGEKDAKVASEVQAMNNRAERAMQAGKYRTAIATGDSAMLLQIESMGKEGVFTDAERTALNSRRDIIAKLTPVSKAADYSGKVGKI